MRFEADPWHASLRFKRIQGAPGLYSVRIGSGYRALGQRDDAGITWFWIGAHAEYDEMLQRL